MGVDAGTEAEYQCRTLESACDFFRPASEISAVCVKTLTHTPPHASAFVAVCLLLPLAVSARDISVGEFYFNTDEENHALTSLLFALFCLLELHRGRFILSWVGAKSACIVVFIAEAVEQNGRYGQDVPEAG